MAARKKKKSSIIPKLLLIVFVVFVSFVIVQNQVRANREKKEYAERESGEKITLSMKKEWLRQELETPIDDAYVANEAQKQGYAGMNERIFVDTRGS